MKQKFDPENLTIDEIIDYIKKKVKKDKKKRRKMNKGGKSNEYPDD